MLRKHSTQSEDPAGLKALQLDAYFGSRKPACEISHRQDIDLGWRFYFVRDDSNAYMLDIDRCMLADWNVKLIVSFLERIGWERLLDVNPKKIVCFTSTAIEIRPWPA